MAGKEACDVALRSLRAALYHHKTRELVEVPLYDEYGTALC